MFAFDAAFLLSTFHPVVDHVLSGKEKVPWHQDEKFPWSEKKKKKTQTHLSRKVLSTIFKTQGHTSTMLMHEMSVPDRNVPTASNPCPPFNFGTVTTAPCFAKACCTVRSAFAPTSAAVRTLALKVTCLPACSYI